MSDREITMFCEDVPGGLSERVLQKVVDELRPDFRIRARGAGSKVDGVLPLLRTERAKKSLCFAIRDRDFLPTDMLVARRANVFDKDVLWPLSRHCIESYFLDDTVLTPAQKALRDKIADERRWLDLTRSVREDGLYKLRKRAEEATDYGNPRNFDDALEVLKKTFDRLLDLDETLRARAKDFDDHGPLWQRVDGKEIYKALGLQEEELPRVPPALRDEIRELLTQMPASW